MTKLLYANGDSFVFGQELGGPRTDEDFYSFSDYQRDNCWAGIISRKLNVDYINKSMPGGSNQRVYRTVMQDISELLNIYKPHELFVLIGLTDSSRYEYYSGKLNKWMPYNTNNPPNINIDPYYVKLWNIMTRHFNSDQGHYDFDQMMILGIQNFLRTNCIPYLLTNSMHNQLVFEDEKIYVSKNILDQRYRYRYYQKISFDQYNKTVVKAPIGPEHHPLEEGHRKWAEHILDHIEKFNLTDNQDLQKNNHINI